MKKLLTTTFLLLFALAIACDRADNANRTENANERAGAERDTGGSDGWITAKVKLALLADQRVSGFATDVDTKDGTVTLSGIVDEQTNKSAAEEVARDVEGVKNVNNQLQVVPGAKRDEISEADDKIEDAISTVMDQDQVLKELSLSADSNAGVVTLDGNVESQEQLLKAAQAVRSVPGVKAVVTSPVTVRNQSS